MTLPRRPLGVYVHFPFCAAICPYCDFAVEVRREIPHRAYADRVIEELALKAPWFQGAQAATLYFGGGTPSLWEASELARVIEAVRARLRLVEGAEVTLEVNPEGVDRDRVAAWVRA